MFQFVLSYVTKSIPSNILQVTSNGELLHATVFMERPLPVTADTCPGLLGPEEAGIDMRRSGAHDVLGVGVAGHVPVVTFRVPSHIPVPPVGDAVAHPVGLAPVRALDANDLATPGSGHAVLVAVHDALAEGGRPRRADVETTKAATGRPPTPPDETSPPLPTAVPWPVRPGVAGVILRLAAPTQETTSPRGDGPATGVPRLASVSRVDGRPSLVAAANGADGVPEDGVTYLRPPHLVLPAVPVVVEAEGATKVGLEAETPSAAAVVPSAEVVAPPRLAGAETLGPRHFLFISCWERQKRHVTAPPNKRHLTLLGILGLTLF